MALLKFVGITLGGYLGWWAGEQVGMMTAMMLSAVGSGLGLYVVLKFFRDYMP